MFLILLVLLDYRFKCKVFIFITALIFLIGYLTLSGFAHYNGLTYYIGSDLVINKPL
ncbi:hypothetical protein C2G38_2092405, partial [Gigaspora rosea]